MHDRTRLEQEVEQEERSRTPASVISIVIVLIFSLCFLGVYAFKLKQDLRRIEHESAILKDTFNEEKVDLERQIRKLLAKPIPSK